MRLLGDENLHRQVVEIIRLAGYDIEWVRDTMRGAADMAILERPDIGALILITSDRDFGDLIFNKGLPQPLSVIYSRIAHRKPDLAAQRIIEELAKGCPKHHILTLTELTTRVRQFPTGVLND